MVRIFQGDLNLIIVNIMERLVFSQYILQNYQNINFDKFQNMLESIQQIVSGYRVAIRDLGVHGEGIGSVDGFTIFVPGALPGETVTAEITLLKKSYALGNCFP